MTVREQPPVPPLGEAAVSRVERGVFAALDRDAAERAADWGPVLRPRWRGRAVVVSASVLAALAVLGVRQFWRAPGLPAQGARVATATSPSHVTVEGAAIDVAPSSAITFADERDGATVVRLERGTVTCEVAPRGARAPFVVEAGTTRVTVVGTRFGVTRVGDRAEVWVTHGTVEVGDDGVTQLVHAGERYVPGAAGPADTVAREEAPEQPPAPPTATPGPALDVVPALGGEAARRPAERSVPALGGEAAQRTAEGSGPLSRPRERVRERADLASRNARRPLSLTLSPADGGEGTGRTGERPPPAVVPPRAPDVAPPAVTGAILRERFQSGAALEVRDPLAAARIYRELASGAGPWAANALFAEARLSAERGQRDAAQALLSSYLERFPSGPNADDARALLGRLKTRGTEPGPPAESVAGGFGNPPRVPILKVASVARFADARGLCVAALVLAMPASRTARGAEAPAMLVATPDPALLSALDAAFSPRGVRVAMADRPLRATSDDPGAGARGADLVWLCDVTPAPAAAPSSTGSRAARDRAVRPPASGTVIIRRVAVATPLSPEDAAALALSVQVALMPGTSPAPVAIASSAPAVEPTRADGAGPRGAHGLTLELSGGFRGGPAGRVFAREPLGSLRARRVRASLRPGGCDRCRFDVAQRRDRHLRGPGPPAVPLVDRSRDLTFRLFARGQASMGPIWLQLDVGPAAHATNGVLGQPQGDERQPPALVTGRLPRRGGSVRTVLRRRTRGRRVRRDGTLCFRELRHRSLEHGSAGDVRRRMVLAPPISGLRITD